MTTTSRGRRPRDEAEQQQEQPDTHGLTVLHRARMLPWRVSAVTAVAACPDGSVFAAGYEDGKVEVFDSQVYNRLAVSYAVGGGCVGCGLVVSVTHSGGSSCELRSMQLPVRICKAFAAEACTPPSETLNPTCHFCLLTLALSCRPSCCHHLHLTPPNNTQTPPRPPPPCPQLIPGADGSEISSLAWARAPEDAHWRLFAATLGGQIHELSIQQLQPIASTDSSGGAVWCLRAAPSTTSSSSGGNRSAQQQQHSSVQLAAACADGSVKLFGASHGEAGALFQRAMPRVEGNVLSLAWHPNGRSLVSGGSDGCMHVWDLQTGKGLGCVFEGLVCWARRVDYAEAPEFKVAACGSCVTRIYVSHPPLSALVACCLPLSNILHSPPNNPPQAPSSSASQWAPAAPLPPVCGP